MTQGTNAMSLDNQVKPLPMYRQRAISEEFAAYCEDAFERRRNSEEHFDEAAYREAMEMTLERLRQLEDEGLA
jgi:hypothetical protein